MKFICPECKRESVGSSKLLDQGVVCKDCGTKLVEFSGNTTLLEKRIAKTLKDKEPEVPVGKLVFFGLLIIVLLIAVFGIFYTIQPGERGLIVRLGSLNENVIQPGFHMKLPVIDKVVKTSVQTQTISFDNKQNGGDQSEYSSLFGASKDLQDVQIGTVVTFHINEKDVPYIYKQYGTGDVYLRNIIEPIIRETVKATASTYTAEELVTKREQFSDDVSKLLNEKLTQKQAIFEKFSVVNFEFSKSFTDAIEAKVTAEQNALQAKNKLEQVKYEADQRITQADAEAKAIEIQTDSLNRAGGKDYISLKWIEKWDGKVSVVSGNTNSILDLRSLQSSSTITT